MPKNSDNGKADPWTQHELDLLHEMVREYDRDKWLKLRFGRFKDQLWWWLGWGFGLPALALTIWEPLVRLWKLFRAN